VSKKSILPIKAVRGRLPPLVLPSVNLSRSLPSVNLSRSSTRDPPLTPNRSFPSPLLSFSLALDSPAAPSRPHPHLDADRTPLPVHHPSAMAGRIVPASLPSFSLTPDDESLLGCSPPLSILPAAWRWRLLTHVARRRCGACAGARPAAANATTPTPTTGCAASSVSVSA
jgi:hypothetical protein